MNQTHQAFNVSEVPKVSDYATEREVHLNLTSGTEFTSSISSRNSIPSPASNPVYVAKKSKPCQPSRTEQMLLEKKNVNSDRWEATFLVIDLSLEKGDKNWNFLSLGGASEALSP